MAREKSEAWSEIVVDRRIATPPFKQVVNAIRHKIATNQLVSGTQLPSVRTLADSVGVTAPTIARAYRQLQEEGLIESQVGVGTIVSDTSQLFDLARERSRDDLDSAVDRFVAPLLAIDYSPAAILSAVERRLQVSRSRQTAVFVAESQSVVDKYVRVLSRELEGVSVSIKGVLLPDLARRDFDAKEFLAGSTRILTSLGLLQQVRDALQAHSVEIPVSVVFTELTLSAIERIGSIPPSQVVLVLTEERHRGSVVGLLKSYLAGSNLRFPASLDPDELQESLVGCSVLVYTLGVQSIVSGLDTAGIESILMEYQLREDALRTLKASFERAHRELVA